MLKLIGKNEWTEGQVKYLKSFYELDNFRIKVFIKSNTPSNYQSFYKVEFLTPNGWCYLYDFPYQMALETNEDNENFLVHQAIELL